MLDQIKFLSLGDGFALIKEGRGFAQNDGLHLSCPFPLDIECSPKIETLKKAIENSQTPSLTLSPSGKLLVKDGRKRMTVDCSSQPLRPVENFGKRYDVPEDLLQKLKMVEPFISTKDHPAWSRGCLFGSSLMATNGLVFVRLDVDLSLTPVNVPKAAIRAVIRTGEPIESLIVSERLITFCLSAGYKITSALLSNQWPDVSGLLTEQRDYQSSSELFKALEGVKDFLPESEMVLLSHDKVETESCTIEGLISETPFCAKAHHPSLMLLSKLVDEYSHENDRFMALKGAGISAVVAKVR